MEKKRKDSSSTVFKVGAVSIAFLILGYQSALFVHRAATLRIESLRDNPDTVFVYMYAETGNGPEAEETPTPAPAERRETAHTEPVQRIRQRTRKVESFRFNPNTVDAATLQRLGFSEKQAAAIVNYRTKGGHFYRKSDFARSFVVADSVYARLEPFIDIPKVDINRADSAALDALPGIGPYFAAKILEYREELGGYTSIEQLMDIKYFDREKFDGLSDLIFCGGGE